ncbi:hypothetical protein LOZ07_006443 [Ophidiomyces ophidiicola]|nr:hypothetical protein LOZ59_000873 [Ophidiomyces ophidiicola]KAI1975110.1 hypothetical protein LOZ56_000901 [Ophidiomyces ophidiicola]KAI2028687.1 hypothetical protein LOZ48_004062 [Ophidiomyces ophidiicola]KAI2148738.1 hypothetical protein LOZ27_001662 [Ophidiomyces ophidiicola]KAI2163542.1 hypothetical protein LOZ25_001574 [Ophidiomyces ophidiicola]
MPAKVIDEEQLPASAPDENELLDVIIIGAGPCGLGVASRLQEETPAAVFTDEEHQRYHWIKKHTGRMPLLQAHHGKMKGVKATKYNAIKADSEGIKYSALEKPRYSTLILDSSGDQWLSKWRRSFRLLEIPQLRSPMFFHVDPADLDGMLAYARETQREKELWELPGCVGKELSKHKKKKRSNARTTGEPEIDERDRKDYYSPGTDFFFDYCDSIAARYKLDNLGRILKQEVDSIKFDYHPHLSETDKIFTVATKEGRIFCSRAVVLAVGPGEERNFPWKLSAEEKKGASHIFDIMRLPSPVIKEKIKARRETNVLVVGGGLTSAQISDVIIKKGTTKVWLLMRSDLKVKYFDVPLNWVGKFKNYEKAVFWSADDDDGRYQDRIIELKWNSTLTITSERLQMILVARNGGSINPRYHKILKDHVANGRVSLHTRTQISTKKYDPCSRTWAITTDPPIPDLPAMDYIYFATGVKTNVNEMPMLRYINQEYPIESKDGMPCITNDLMWKDDMPLFCTGRLATLRLGPAGPNLEGARGGAERIAWALDEILGKREYEADEPSRIAFSGLGNRYAGLSNVE